MKLEGQVESLGDTLISNVVVPLCSQHVSTGCKPWYIRRSDAAAVLVEMSAAQEPEGIRMDWD